ncbi:MAG: hypothetical protein GX444_14775 [Myxococcales bacterium]|nr:hypothetical protein [Myxococcales bacterium]
MSEYRYPKYFADRFIPKEDAYKATVHSGMKIASGFATSEPSAFYKGLWDYIQQEDLRDIAFRQALFMGPYRLLIGDALSSKGLFNGLVGGNGNGGGFTSSMFKNLAQRANTITKKVEGLNKLVEHFRELQERQIHFVSAFIGAAENMVIPANTITRLLYPDFVGRNKSRLDIINMQSVHFPEAVDAMAFDDDGKLNIDLFVAVMTPPDEKGEMSHGVANGATSDMLELAFRNPTTKILLYINKNYPFTYGMPEAPNTLPVERFKEAALAGRLFVVEDDSRVPALPPHSFDNPSEVEVKIAENLVNHMEMHRDLTYGRAVQVGIGGTGVLAIKKMRDSNWTGRSYTEMLEPFTLDLFEAGKIAGTHWIEKDGTRRPLDGKLVCTFSLAEDSSDFYQRLDKNPNVLFAPASRVVLPEGFYGGLGINNILGIDFQGHVNSAGRDKNHYSGVGGAAMIIRGLARGGVAYLCLKSLHQTPEGEERSSVMPFLPQGTPISMVGPDLMGTCRNAHFFLVTEYGVAKINAMSQDRFIRSLISVAHPKHQDWLKRRAWDEFRVKV